MKKRIQNDYRELEPVTRFKMYKDGKNWVTSGVSKFLMWITPSRIVNGSSNSEKKGHADGTAIKVLASFSALLGGSVVVSQDVFADTTNTATEKNLDSAATVADKEQVTLPNTAQVKENSTSSASINSSEFGSESQLISTSEST